MIFCGSEQAPRCFPPVVKHLILLRALSPGKRIQYICKQGGQTFLIESSALLDRIRAAGTGLRLQIFPSFGGYSYFLCFK